MAPGLPRKVVADPNAGGRPGVGPVVASAAMMPLLTNQTQYPCSELVKVLYEDPHGGTHETIANLEDISSNWATLLCDARLDTGLPVSFCVKGRDLYGFIRARVFDPILGWFVSITLDPDSRWCGRLFVPEHFLALCASARNEPQARERLRFSA
jgi:hypothetical protein